MPYRGDALGVLDTRYLQLDASNDPVTAGLEINAATTTESVLILQTTDDNATNPILEIQGSGGTPTTVIDEEGWVGIDTGAAALNQKAEINYGHLRFNQEPAPNSPAVAVNPAGGNLNGNYYYRITFVTATGETEQGGISPVVAPANEQVDISNIATGSARVTARRIYRTVAGIGSYEGKGQLVTTINDNTTTTYTDNTADGALGAFGPWTNTTGGLQYIGATKMIDIGSHVLAIGFNAGLVNTGLDNLFVGLNAGRSNTVGYLNVFFGNSAGYNNLTGERNIYIGDKAGYAGTSSSKNLFFGQNAGRFNTTGDDNVAVGYEALYSNTTAGQNMAIGGESLHSCTTGNLNTAVGAKALYNLIGGVENVAIGQHAGYFLTSSSHNILIGRRSGFRITTGGNNTYLGYHCGYETTGGARNICVGYQAGDVLTVGDDNIVIGYDIDPTANNVSNELNIGALLYGKLDINRGGINVTPPNLLAAWHVDQSVDDEAIPVLILDQADISEGFINFIGSDRGVITGATNSVGSVRAEINGVVYRLALYADA